MPRIPAELIESIKRNIPCRQVLEASGSVFAKHGADIVCVCPFHADKTPSLIISERKNLWRCHGACGIGGDVIALTVKMKGVSFRHAVELLAEGLPVTAGQAGLSSFAADDAHPAGSRSAGPVKYASVRALPCPLDASADDTRLLSQVVDYYAARLAVPGNAGRAYLVSRGLDDADFIRRFALGFADRSLGLRLPTKQRKEGAELRSRLAAMGVFRAESGHEHFSGSVVFPIHGGTWHRGADERSQAGAVVGMYGRKVVENLRTGTPKHTYLPGAHRGVWNCGPDLCDGNGAVIVCEALLDAASCWCAGLRNVTAAYGVNGWTADHDLALAESQPKDVFLAYDADAAGDAGADRVADQLIARGFTAYRVVLPPGQDVNDVHRAAGASSGDELRRLIASARWLGGAARVVVPAIPSAAIASFISPLAVASVPTPAPASVMPGGVAVHVAGDEIHVDLGTRSYRVRGLFANRGAEVMKINLRIAVARPGADAVFHIDTLDLYQTRFRQAFTAAAAAECGLHPDVIKADLGKVLLTLECQQSCRTGGKEQSHGSATADAPAADPARAMTPDEHAAALALLQDPALSERIIADLTRSGLVGEDVNKLVGYIAATSRKLAAPLAIVVQSSSAAGKSTLMDKVLSLMPPEDVRHYSAISGKSPFYLGTANLKHRILSIAEEEGARRASYALKLLQSDGFLSMAATGKDPESGRMVTHDYRVEGPVMLMLTTTAIDVDPELLNRCVVLTVDEEAGQTAAIQAAQRVGRTLPGMQAARERAAIAALHRNAQRLLAPVAVVNPHANALSFAAHQTRLRRDHAKYLSLIDAVTFLHQHQRETKTVTFPDGSELRYIDVTQADIALANRLAAAVLGRSLDDLPPQTRRLWDQLSAYLTTKAATNAVAIERTTFTRREVQAALHWSYDQVRVHLERLVAQEFVVAAGGGFGQVVTYRPVLMGHVSTAVASATTTADTPTPMTLSLGGVWGGFGGSGTPHENDDKSRAVSANVLGLGGLGVCTQGGAEIVDGASYVVASPQAADATPVVVCGLERAG
jgi:DNA primase